MMKNAILHHPLHVFLLVVLGFLLCMKTSSLGPKSLSEQGKMTRCNQRERRALLGFKHSHANKDNLLDSWKQEEEDCCKWIGVGCDNLTGHVTDLHLSSLVSPSPWCSFPIDSTSVNINRSLLDLQYLKYLDLSRNSILGFPENIGSLTNLVHLDFSETCIGGLIPYQIGKLSKLQYLNLSSSGFDGPIPKLMGSLKNLRYLDLSSNSFSGVIPHELGNLSKLQYLDLSLNQKLPGQKFEWLFNLSSLTHLDLSFLNISPPGIWESFIERIPSLSILRLYSCELSAPSSILSNISSSISTIDLGVNHINSSIFNWISRLRGSLVELNLEMNELEGRIPESFGNFTTLTILNLRNNLLNGPVPNSFSLMTALTYLDLSVNQLNGPLPYSFNLLTALTYLDVSYNELNGGLANSIGNLTNLKVASLGANNFTGNLEGFLTGPFALLEELSIYNNKLTGSLPDITLLPSLRKLDMSSNQLNGYLPTIFQQQSALQVLELSYNHLRGFLPDFTRFTSLEFLRLSNNEFSGSLPDFTGFTSLQELNLQDNGFSGSLPDFTGCTSLRELNLRENQFTQWETQSIGLLYSLEELDLSMNSIRSTISEAQLSNISSLRFIRTSFNPLTFEFNSQWLPPFQLWVLSMASCKLGPNFPHWIRTQREILDLDISNNQISDTIPNWFWNLSSITSLNLSSNQIRGVFSSKLVNIQEIDLSSNYFHGPIPSIPSKCLKINLSQNKFSGTLLSLGVTEELPLSSLDISHNQLVGSLLDNWAHFDRLVFLNFGYNNFSGRIPMSIGHLTFLQTLILRSNKLYGEPPASLRNCSNLGFVDFGLNKLSGKIPSWIGEGLPHLYALILKSNRFSGHIPFELCQLSNIHFLDVSINRISGNIPACFGNLTAMIRKGTEVAEHVYQPPQVSRETRTYTYSDNVLAGWKGQEVEYGRNFVYLKMIDLSTNKLTGEIPIGITRLLDLKGLNLSGNGFYGEIPPEIGQLKVLESLDLSKNNFTGEIPVSMSGLNFLAYLDLSENHFSGRIPSGPQLQTFNISSYEGNAGLCGKPLTHICPENVPDDDMHPSTGEYEAEGDNSEYERWLYVSAILGFSTTFWGIIGSLVLNRRWRDAYFFFLYNLKERFHVALAVRIARFQRTV